MARAQTTTRRLRVVALGALLTLTAYCHLALAQAPSTTTAQERAACAKGRGQEAATACLRARVWFEYGLATVATGLNERNEHVGRRLTLVVVGPGEEAMTDTAEAAIRARHHAVVKQVEATLRQGLDFSIVAGDDQFAAAVRKPGAEPKKILQAVASAIADDVQTRLLEASLAYERLMASTWRTHGVDGSRFRLAIVDLPCEPRTGCQIPNYAHRPDNLSFDRYSKYRDWLRRSNAMAVSTPQVLQVGRTGAGAVQLTAQSDKMVRPSPGGWPKEPSVEEATRRFERLVEQARRTGFEVSTTVPELIELSQRSALAIADVIKSPPFAISRLPQDGKGVLKSVSDEIARTRLHECARLRGAISAEQVGACAGYQVTAPELAACLTDGRCWPSSGKTMLMDILAIGSPQAMSKLAEVNAFARMRLGSIEQVEAAVKECAGDRQMPSHDVTAMCVMKKRLGQRERSTLECIERLRRPPYKPDGAVFEQCLAVASLGDLAAAQARCLKTHSADSKALALCATAASLPPASRRLVECANGGSGRPASREAVSDCLLKQAAPEVATAVACMKKESDWRSAALCAAGNKLPPDAQKAIGCAEKSQGNATKLGVCMVGDKIPGDGGKVAMCMVQSGGDPFGTAVCSAGDKLSPEQRIALQCAASTGGEPTSFAICAGGQLAIKEFMGCRGKKFGDSHCFGPNNEFRKLAKNLGVEIGPNSVVADVVNVHLQVLDAQVRLVEGALKEAQKVAKALEQAGQALGKGAEHIAREGGKAACRVVTLGMARC
ncbi:MAG: hypothetical protein JNN03_00850 [Rubrivivax sp.]|nr:hypothetical protein [Rubrivivax sp.]